jgi:hypothetical protein
MGALAYILGARSAADAPVATTKAIVANPIESLFIAKPLKSKTVRTYCATAQDDVTGKPQLWTIDRRLPQSAKEGIISYCKDYEFIETRFWRVV